MADSESAALTGLGDTPALGAVGETRTLMTLATATSRLRVYQFRHDRISDFNSQLDLRLAESSELYIGFRTLQAFSEKNFRSRFSSVLAGVVGFKPTNGGFRIRCLNRTWRYPSTWCGRRDSNSHDSRHSHLKAARLPISPRPLALEKNYCLPRVIPSQPGKNTGTGCKAANINAEPGWIASHPSQQALRSRLQREPASSVRSSPYPARRLDAADSAC